MSLSEIHIHELGKVIPTTECYVISNDEFLMFRRSPSSKIFPGYLSIPGGHIDHDNDVLTTIIQEIEEETGVKVKKENIRLKAIAIHNHTDRGEIYLVSVFRVDLPEKPEIKYHDVEGESVWIPIKDLTRTDNIFPPIKPYFEFVLGNKEGILYTNSLWAKAQIVKTLSTTVGK